MGLGISVIRRETFGSALALGRETLHLLGFAPYEAYRLARLFQKKDEDTLPELYRIFLEDRDKYVSMYQQHNEELATLMQLDEEEYMVELDRAWTAQNPEA
jgi:hypothetical protein